MKKKLVPLFLLAFIIPIMATAQERYKWFSVTSVTFYDLKQSSCRITNVQDIPNTAKGIGVDKAIWSTFLPKFVRKQQDVLQEKSCYILVIQFRQGERIPFLYLPSQKTLFDLRKDHFNYLFFDTSASKVLDVFLKNALLCSESSQCSEIH